MAQTPNDVLETVLDLAKGFAVLSRSSASSLSGEDAFTLQALMQRLMERAERCDWDETLDIIRDAERAVGRRTSPR
ncbi:hypothetical protein [Sphingomonas rubra]|uniref:hypothetical protein n=1 Tax=Sphingomonas rubra TaxID=634430 RepID=UPI0015A5E5B0|nr:hypothetical protein [Sphingomonas rubra]